MISDFNNIDKSVISSSFLLQFLKIKEENKDYIVLFEIGEFYETLFSDAILLSSIMGFSLKPKKYTGIGEVAHAGFPKKVFDICIKKILQEKYRVCVCEQVEDANNKTTRIVSRKYTQGTIIEEEFLDANENNYIAVVQMQGDKCYFSYADVSTGQFYKTSGSFKQICFELEYILPNELLIFKKQADIFKDVIEKYNTTLLDDEFFVDSLIEEVILKYCEKVQLKYLVTLDDVIEYKLENHLLMDEITRRNLEITRTRTNHKKKGSIFWFLNYTKTPMGSRLLKKYISEPLLDIDLIMQRQNAVKELAKDDKKLSLVEQGLENFCDLSRLCAKLSNQTIDAQDLLLIACSYDKLFLLYNLLSKYNSKLLLMDIEKINKLSCLAEDIKEAICAVACDDEKLDKIIKDGYDASLDYLRNKLSENEVKITKFFEKQKKKLNIPNITPKYSRVLGYYIEVSKSKTSALNCEYLTLQVLANCSRYTTFELKTLQEENFNLKYKISELEKELFLNVKRKAKEFVELIREIAKEISVVDVLASFARCAINNKLIAPEFCDKEFHIKDGFHPSLLKLNNNVVANDTSLKPSEVMFLTGANMSGKSTYLKHNAIICLLAQMGSFVPAKSAKLSIIDKILLRQDSVDDIVTNNSSFMVEMNDLKFILENVTPKSLVLLDEPAKSTNATESAGIIKGFCEYFIKKYSTRMIIVTHNFDLADLIYKYPDRISNFIIGTQDGLVNDRKIRRGFIKTSFALNTAILAGLPDEMIEMAKKYL